VGCFEGRGLPKESQQPGQPEVILREGSSRDLPGDSVCGDSTVAGAPQGLHHGRERPF